MIVSSFLLAAALSAGPSTESDPDYLHGFLPIVSLRYSDVNGDLDGFPDTNETIDLFVRVRNPARSHDLTNVAIALVPLDARIDCVIPSEIVIPTIAAGTEVETPIPFRLHVHPNADREGPDVICNDPGPGGTCSNFAARAGGCSSNADCLRPVGQDYSAPLELRIRSAEVAEGPRPPQPLAIDLDLDAVNPVGPTATFADGFENGLSNFTLVALDTNKATNAASDGYRCRYNDPDLPGSNSYGEPNCYLGFASGQSPLNDWHVHTTSSPDAGRAYQGTLSAHYGVHVEGQDTTSLSQMDAIMTRAVRLASRVCANDTNGDKRSCNGPQDCAPVGGGPCIAANPELIFKHQVSAPRNYPGRTIDRGVVEVATTTRNVWEKAYPSMNIYEMQTGDNYVNCRFDPIDDGNDEDDSFDPGNPAQRLGPSTTCYPEFVFSYIGDTGHPFDAQNLGWASDGPTLAGSLGPGSWIESRFDLTRYRGRSIRVRFLYTSIQVYDFRTYWELWHDDREFDDGWYIDDVRVTETLGTPAATLTSDLSDSSALPGNLDSDARGDDCDCAPSDPTAFAVPAEIAKVRFAGDKTTLTWTPTAPAYGSATIQDVVRGALAGLPVGSGATETCLADAEPGANLSDATVPTIGTGFWYLIRARNPCGNGGYGSASDGTPRSTATCM